MGWFSDTLDTLTFDIFDLNDSKGDAARAAAQTASDTELQMFEKSLEITAPWRELGQGLIPDYKNALSGPGEFTASPGYEFVKQEGLDAITNALSARGKVDSGQAVKQAGRYVTGLASQEYGNFWNRYKDRVNMLAGGVQGGQQVSNQTAQNALATGQNVAGIRAAGIIGAQNASDQNTQNWLNFGGTLLGAVV